MRALLFLLPFIFLFPANTDALSCAPAEPNLAYAAYEDSVFVHTFIVTYEPTGNLCDAAPVVNDGDEQILEIFEALSKPLSEPLTDGTFSIPFRCMSHNEETGCFPKGSLKKISDSPDDFFREKNEWQSKAHHASRVSTSHKWFSFGLILTVFFISVAWPWLLVMKKPQLRTRFPALIVVAIPVQGTVVFSAPLFVWSYDIVSSASRLISNILLIVIIIEILYLLYCFTARNRGKVFPNKE